MTGLELMGNAAGLLPVLVRASLEGALAVALVALLVRAVPSLPPRVRCTLWWAACLKLVLGLVWVSPLELPVLPAAAAAVPGLQAEAAAAHEGTEGMAAGWEQPPGTPLPAGVPATPWEGTPGRSLAAAGAGSGAVQPAPERGSPGRQAGVAPALAVRTESGTGATGAAGAVPPVTADPDAHAETTGGWPARLPSLLRPVAAGAGILWLLGVVLAVASGWRRHRRLVRVLRSAEILAHPPLGRRLDRLARRFGIPSPPVLVTAEVESPQVVGILRPRLLLPPDAARRATTTGRVDGVMEMVLAHELAHLRRRDLLLGWVPALARGLFFFHPLAALAAREYSLAREAACDAEVLDRLDATPRDYGRMLLTWGAVRHGGLPAAALGDHRQLKRRLIMLENASKNRRPLRPWIALAVLLPAVLLLLPIRLVAAPDVDTALEGTNASAAPMIVTGETGGDGPDREAPRNAAAAAPAPAPAEASARTVQAVRAPRAPAAPAVAPAALPPLPSAPAAPSMHTASLPTLPPAPRAPAAPSVPSVAAPDAPVAPAAPAGNSWFWSSDDDGEPVVYVRGDQKIGFHTSTGDSRRIEALRRGDEPLLWFVRDGEEYVVRDPALLARAEAAWQPVMELGRAQGELGGEQGELGGEQGELGAEQGRLGAEQARLAAEQARLAAASTAASLEQAAAEMEGGKDAEARHRLRTERREQAVKMRALAEEERALAESQRALARQQRALAAQQRALAEKQRALAERQREASKQAEAELDRILDEALRTGKAERVD